MTLAKTFTSLTDPVLTQIIREGAIGVIPTDTVYGLVASAEIKAAVDRMYSIKSRERQPGTTIAASVRQLEKLGFPATVLEVASKYWPDAVSVQMVATDIATYLSTNQSVMAARIPNNPELLSLLENTGPLMTTSANQPGLPTATTIDEAIDSFGDTVDFYVDHGAINNAASTIIEILPDHTVIVHRNGSVQIQ